MKYFDDKHERNSIKESKKIYKKFIENDGF